MERIYSIDQRTKYTIHILTLVFVLFFLTQINLSTNPTIQAHLFQLNLLGVISFILLNLYYIAFLRQITTTRLYLPIILIFNLVVYYVAYLTGLVHGPLNYLLFLPALYAGFLLTPSAVLVIGILNTFAALILFTITKFPESRYDFFIPLLAITGLAFIISRENQKREGYFFAAMQIAGDLEGINRIKDEFTTLISHHLRTPLTGLKGFLEIMQQEGPDLKNDQTMILKLQGEINRLEELTESLADISGLKSGKLKIEIKRVLLTELIDKAIGKEQKKADEKNITFTRTLQCPSDQHVFVDLDFMTLAIANIIDNSLKFSHQNQKVTITTNLTPSGITITVGDQGVGIPETELTRIFQIFHRGSKNFLDYDIEGVGIGLYFTYTIVELHKGSITIDSKEGQGTTVTIKLPVPQLDTFLETLD